MTKYADEEQRKAARRTAQQRYKANHPGRRAEISRRYRERHLEEELKRKRDYARKLYASPDWYFKYIERYYGPGAGEHYKLRLKIQDGGCAVCGTIPVKDKLHLDHDHDTRKLRGLLCGDCNRALGICKENAERIRKLAQYIEEWGIAKAA